MAYSIDSLYTKASEKIGLFIASYECNYSALAQRLNRAFKNDAMRISYTPQYLKRIHARTVGKKRLETLDRPALRALIVNLNLLMNLPNTDGLR